MLDHVPATPAPGHHGDLRVALAILALGLSAAIGLGIGRFAYALVLPDMQAALGWNYTQAGLMNTLNAAGYLAGALATPTLARRLGQARTVEAGTLICVLALLLMVLSSADGPIAASRFAAGFGSALAFVAGGALAAMLAQGHPTRATFLLGLFYTGPGLGIVISGLGTPPLLAVAGPGSWWIAWGLLTLTAALATIPLVLVTAKAGVRDRATPSSGKGAPMPLRRMAALLAGYGGFGAGYIAYMTFMIAWVREGGAGAGLQAVFWGVVGLGGMASPWLWSWVLTRLRGGRAVGALTAVTFLGALLPLMLGPRLPVLLVSAGLFGSALFAVVAATTIFVRRNLAPADWPGGIAAVTVAFGVGQTLGPFATGILSDMAGGRVSAGLLASALLLCVSAAVSALQRDLGPRSVPIPKSQAGGS